MNTYVDVELKTRTTDTKQILSVGRAFRRSVTMDDPAHILIVDDEQAIRTILRTGLEAEGYATSEAADRASLFRCLETEPVTLITLDLVLGDADGLELAREIRSKRNLPIVMITGKNSPIDRVTGLEQGADDYITKPFHIREIIMRVHSVLQRYKPEPAEPSESLPRVMSFEAGALDTLKREFRSPEGIFVDLTGIEFSLLEVFLRYPARVLSRDEISLTIMGKNWSPLDRTIDGHVARLRRKIEPPGEAPTLIKSVRGVGYVFTGEVRLD